MFNIGEARRVTYPGAVVGFLAMQGVANPERHAALERQKGALERDLRSRYQGCDRTTLREVPELRAYRAYYRRFKKTYHVQLQLETVVLRASHSPGRPAWWRLCSWQSWIVRC